MNYTLDKFLDLSKMGVAMLLRKYKEIYPFEIKLTIIGNLFRYFKVLSVNAITDEKFWCVNMADIISVENTIMSMEISDFKQYLDLIGTDYIIEVPTTRKKSRAIKPTCAEDLLDVITEDMTQQEKYYAIMEAWNIKSVRSAQRLMQKFNISRNYNNRGTQQATNNDSESKHMEMVDLQLELMNLKSQLAELKKENEQLRNELKKKSSETTKEDTKEPFVMPECTAEEIQKILALKR